MASRPPTVGKTTMFWSSTLYHVTMQVHESSQPITHCRAWQPRTGKAVDRFWDWLSCRCNGFRMAKAYRQKTLKLHSNWGHPSTIVSQLIHEDIKIPGGYDFSWNSTPFFLKSAGPLNCTFTEILNISNSEMYLKTTDSLFQTYLLEAHEVIYFTIEEQYIHADKSQGHKGITHHIHHHSEVGTTQSIPSLVKFLHF